MAMCMMGKCLIRGLVLGIVVLPIAGPASLVNADDQDGQPIVMGPLEMTAPEGWVKKQPSVRIIAYEFTVPAAKGDKNNGRMTVMVAGGSIDANIQRWYGQFKQPDGGDTAKVAVVEKKKIAGHDVHLVDIAGTYLDRRGPVAPAVARKNYRMLATIIETKQGNFFVKFYGPRKTVAENEEAFVQMTQGLRAR